MKYMLDLLHLTHTALLHQIRMNRLALTSQGCSQTIKIVRGVGLPGDTPDGRANGRVCDVSGDEDPALADIEGDIRAVRPGDVEQPGGVHFQHTLSKINQKARCGLTGGLESLGGGHLCLQAGRQPLTNLSSMQVLFGMQEDCHCHHQKAKINIKSTQQTRASVASRPHGV